MQGTQKMMYMSCGGQASTAASCNRGGLCKWHSVDMLQMVRLDSGIALFELVLVPSAVVPWDPLLRGPEHPIFFDTWQSYAMALWG